MLMISLNELSKNAVNPTLFILGMLIISITGVILLIAVFFKFIEHVFRPQKLAKGKSHFFSTFGMTLIVVSLFNFWFSTYKQLKIEDTATQCIYFGFGLFLLLFGLGWHIWSKINIGTFWSDGIEIKQEHSLVNTGAYRLARHPMYGSLLMWCWGASFITFNWITLAITSFVFLPLMLKRAKDEEKELLELNIDYTIYKENVKMFCPTLKGTYSIIIRIIALLIFAWFVWSSITLNSLILLSFIQVYLGYCLVPEKVAFSYRSKSFITIVVWIASLYWYPIYYFYYIIILMLLYGLKWDCPCMIMYEKFGGCPCIKLLNKCTVKIKI